MTLLDMKGRCLPTIVAVLMVLAVSPVTAQPVSRGVTQTTAEAALIAAKAGLLGTWALVLFDNTDTNGKLEQPFGAHPKGYFVYDATGHVHIQIARDPASPEPAAEAGTDSARRDSPFSYLAYFGTYKLDLEKQTVTHVVEGSSFPPYRNTQQVRPFSLVGDVLVIGTTLPDGSKYYRELHRVK